MRNHELLRKHLATAEGIAWDTCHKIYVLMDSNQVAKMRGNGYEAIITTNEANPKQLYSLVRKWYGDSCGLKFVESVATTENDEEWVSIIGQGERFYA